MSAGRIGIDLGTTNSVAARSGIALEIEGEGHATMPSVVAFLPNGKVQVGAAARRRRAIDSSNAIFSSKRIIGRLFDSYETRNFRERYPFEIVEMPDATLAFETRAGKISPVDAAAFVLTGLRDRAGIDPNPGSVTLTVPAAFAERQRSATLEAARKADLGEATLLDEPTATAHAYLEAGHGCGRALVYDLGGGTFDCAVIDCGASTPSVVAHVSDLVLGGDDIDHRLAEWVTSHVLEKHNWDLSNYSEIYDRLLYRCEAAKIQLSLDQEAPIELAQVDPECPAMGEAVTLTQGLLAKLSQDIVRRSFIACDEVLRAADLRPRDIDRVFLAGGTTLMPTVQEGVRAYFGHGGMLEFDPTEVVAIGASLARL